MLIFAGNMYTASFFFEANNSTLHGQWIDERDGRPLLIFLHEGLGSIPQWKQFPEELCKATNLPGLVYERRGFGKSDAHATTRQSDYLHKEALEELPAVLSALQITEPYWLIGHSDGGSIALLHASTQPDTLLGIITMAAHVFVEEETLAGIREARAFYESSPKMHAGLARYHGDKTKTAFYAWNDTWLLPEFRAWNIEAILPQITCPSLIIQGKDDAYGTVKQVEAITHNVTGQSLSLMLDDCGHAPHIEQREVVLSEMVAVIAGLSV